MGARWEQWSCDARERVQVLALGWNRKRLVPGSLWGESSRAIRLSIASVSWPTASGSATGAAPSALSYATR